MLSVNQLIALIIILFLLLTTTGYLCYRLGRRVGALEKAVGDQEASKWNPISFVPYGDRLDLPNNMDPVVPGKEDKQ